MSKRDDRIAGDDDRIVERDDRIVERDNRIDTCQNRGELGRSLSAGLGIENLVRGIGSGRSVLEGGRRSVELEYGAVQQPDWIGLTETICSRRTMALSRSIRTLGCKPQNNEVHSSKSLKFK